MASEESQDWRVGKSLHQRLKYILHGECSTDVSFLVKSEGKEETVRAHRLILTSGSQEFESLLRDEPRGEDVTVTLEDVDVEALREVIQFLYFEEVNITAANVYDILHAATRLKVHEVASKCSLVLQNSVCVANVCDILNGSIKYSDDALIEKCLAEICENGEEVMKLDAFTSLFHDALMRIAGINTKYKASEISFYHACIKWAEAECRRVGKDITDENKRYALGDILYQIRFHQMSITDFSDLTRSSSLLTAEEKVEMYEAIIDRQRGRDLRHTSKFNLDTRFQALTSVNRFQSVSSGWSCNGRPDAITFTTDKDVIIKGVGLYGGVTAGCRDVQVQLLDEHDKVLSDTGHVNMHSDGSKEPVNVEFSAYVTVKATRKYTVKATIKGGKTHYGNGGNSSVVMNNVTFTFTHSSHCSNGSDVSQGQIPSLLCLTCE